MVQSKKSNLAELGKLNHDHPNFVTCLTFYKVADVPPLSWVNAATLHLVTATLAPGHIQGEYLTLLTNAAICWNTIYTEKAVKHTKHIKESHIARLAPTSHKHINFHGKYNFHTPKTPPKGQLRPLRNRSS